MRLFKKFLLFATEIVFLFFGFIFSVGVGVYLHLLGSKYGPVAFLLSFFLIYIVLIWFRRKTMSWTTFADASAWLHHRSWRRLHPRHAKYLRILKRSLLWVPSLYSVLVLFFLPIASHAFYSGTHLVNHYQFSMPLSWLIIKGLLPADSATWVFFSNQGAARYGFTPLLFNHSMPSSAIFFTSDPEQPAEWRLPESERAGGHTTHLAVRQFRLGMITVTCYEYRYVYSNTAGSSSNIFARPVLWESLCSTQPNRINYNLRVAFSGNRDDLPAFYKVLNSAVPALPGSD